MKRINLLNPYIFKYLWNTEKGKVFITDLVNSIFNDNCEYDLLPFYSDDLNNVRSYVILESSKRIVFIDFNFRDGDFIVKNDLLLVDYLKMTTKKVVELVIFNDFYGNTNKIGNILDIYSNDDKYKFMYSKGYKAQLKLNEEITNIMYQLTDDEYKIYLHENKLKKRM